MRVGTAASIARDESGFTRLDFVSRYRTRSPKFLVTAALNCPWRCCSRWLGHCLRTRKWSSRISRLTRAQNSSPRFEGDGPARPWACRVGLKVLPIVGTSRGGDWGDRAHVDPPLAILHCHTRA